jgi:hypothetical protein
MVQCRRGFGFTDESLLFIIIMTEMVWQEFKRYKAVEIGVMGFIYNTHAAAAEFFNYFKL